MNRKEPIAPWSALNLETRQTTSLTCPHCKSSDVNLKLESGWCKCLECSYAWQLEKTPEQKKTLVLKQVIDLYPRMLGLLKAASLSDQLEHHCKEYENAGCLKCQIQALLNEVERVP